MSEQLPEEGHELALVLNRVNALMKQKKATDESASQDDEIPLLTDVYEGEPLVFEGHDEKEFSPSEREADDSSNVHNLIVPEDAEKLLAEMLPLIQVEVKKAVLQELVKLDKKLGAKLEKDLVKILKERLQSGIKT